MQFKIKLSNHLGKIVNKLNFTESFLKLFYTQDFYLLKVSFQF